MSNERVELFNEKRPAITEQEIVEAGREGRLVVSFGAQPVIVQPPHIAALAIKFAYGDGKTETVIIDSYACEVLRLLFQDMNQATWKASVTTPPGQKPN